MSAHVEQPTRPAGSPATHGGRRRMNQYAKSLFLAVAASVVIAVVSSVSLRKGGHPIPSASYAPSARYAQAIKALTTAKSLHLRCYESTLANAIPQLALRSEAWFSEGTARTRSLGDSHFPTRETIEDIDSQWTIYPDRKLAVRRAAVTPSQQIIDSFSRGMLLESINRGRYVPGADEVIDGARCHLFVASPKAATTQPDRPPEVLEREYGKVHLWVDEGGAVRRSETYRLVEGHWNLNSRIEAQYDGATDPGQVVSEPPKDYQRVDLDERLEQMFDLGQPNDVVETNGMIVAFHDIQRLTDGSIAVTITTLPTLENRERLLLRNRGSDDWDGYGPGECSLLSGPGGYEVVPLAEAADRWMRINWVILRSQTLQLAKAPQIEISFAVYVRALPLLKAEGLKEFGGETRHVLSLPNRTPVQLTVLADTVYLQLQEIARNIPLWISTQLGDPVSQDGWSSRAERYHSLRVSHEDFVNAVSQRLGSH